MKTKNPILAMATALLLISMNPCYALPTMDNQTITQAPTMSITQDTILKTVTYYTTQLPYTDVSALSGYSEGDGEILDKKILSLTDAIDLATYDATREVLQHVYDDIHHKNNE